MDFQSQVLKQLKERNNVTNSLKELIGRCKTLYHQKLSLEAQCVALQHRTRELESQVGTGGGVASKELEDALRQKQEELNESYKVRAEASQQVLELNQKIKEMADQFQNAQRDMEGLQKTIDEEKQSKQKLQQNQEEKDIIISVLKAELLQLQVRIDSIPFNQKVELVKAEEKVRDIAKENKALQKRCLAVVEREAEMKNMEVEAAKSQFSLSSVFGLSSMGTTSTTTPNAGVTATNSGNLSASAVRKPSVDLDGGVFGVTVVPHQCKKTLRVEKGELNSVAFSPTGTHFVTGGLDKTVRVWDTATGRIKTSLHGAEKAIMCVGFSWNNEYVLAGSNDNAVRVWNFGLARLHHNLMGHSGKVYSAKFSCDSTKIVTGSHDRSIRTWDLERGYCNRTIFCSSSCNDLDLSRDGNLGISGHLDNHLRFWDVKNGDIIHDSVNIHSSQITSVSMSPVLTNSRDNTLKLVDVRNFQVLKTFSHEHFSNGLNWSRSCLSPDGRFACAGSTDGDLYVWDITTGKLETLLSRKDDESGGGLQTISCCAWSPLGATVATSDRGGLVSLWG